MQNNYSSEALPAGFFARASAYLIDRAIVAVWLLVVRILLGIGSALFPVDFLGRTVLFTFTYRDVLFYLLRSAYFIVLTAETGTTIGKGLMNLKVIPSGGGRLTWFDVAYRETIGRFLSSFFAGIGYLMIGMDGQKRGLHDMICDTRVVYAAKTAALPAKKDREINRNADEEIRLDREEEV